MQILYLAMFVMFHKTAGRIFLGEELWLPVSLINTQLLFGDILLC